MIDKPTHKMVDGKRVELTDNECTCLMQEWEENQKILAQKDLERQNQEKIKEDTITKLANSIGVSVDDLRKIIP